MKIAVIGHLPSKMRLPAEFSYLTRKSDVDLSPTIPTDHNFNADSFVWSEYGAWFENSSILNDADITGLYHYRCALNLFSKPIDDLPINLRYIFLKFQIPKLHEYRNTLAVGEPNFVPEGVWGQFLSAHPESEEILLSACKHYDSLLNHSPGSAIARITQSNFYYPRNIFVSDTKYGKAWMDLSFKLAVALDTEFPAAPNNRWGGFVLERIFSLFVEDFAEENDIAIKTFKQIYFLPLIPWVKSKLLKKKFVKAIQRILLGRRTL